MDTGRNGQDGYGSDTMLPIDDYDALSEDEILAEFEFLPADEIEELLLYEVEHQNRQRLVEAYERRLAEDYDEFDTDDLT